MAEATTVEGATVVHVLETVAETLGFAVQKLDAQTVLLVQAGSVPEVIVLSDCFSRRHLHYFSRKFGVKIEWFFHPEMCCAGTKTAQ